MIINALQDSSFPQSIRYIKLHQWMRMKHTFNITISNKRERRQKKECLVSILSLFIQNFKFANIFRKLKSPLHFQRSYLSDTIPYCTS